MALDAGLLDIFSRVKAKQVDLVAIVAVAGCGLSGMQYEYSAPGLQ